MVMEIVPMTAVAERLAALGGEGRWKACEWRIRVRLNWHTKAKSAIRHLVRGEQVPTLEEVREIEAAHLKYCAEKVEANRDENTRLFASMHSAIAAMEKSDPEFYRPHIEAIRDTVLRLGNIPGGTGGEG